jgi:hypothetical protein
VEATLPHKVKFLLQKKTELEPGVEVEFGFDTRLLMAFPRIWKIGTSRMECGCTYRWRKSNKRMICMDCLKADLGWDDDGKTRREV